MSHCSSLIRSSFDLLFVLFKIGIRSDVSIIHTESGERQEREMDIFHYFGVVIFEVISRPSLLN